MSVCSAPAGRGVQNAPAGDADEPPEAEAHAATATSESNERERFIGELARRSEHTGTRSRKVTPGNHETLTYKSARS
jgi:hypothetical protein